MTKYLVKCDKCGKEFKTRLYTLTDQHKFNDCMGYFKIVKVIEP